MVAYGVAMRGHARLLVLAAIAAALFCALALGVETNRVAGFDEAVRMEVHSLASPFLTLVAEKVTWLGTLGVLALFGVVAVAVLMHAGRRDGAVMLTVTMVGAVALENGLKFSFQRVRPPPFFGSEPLTYSFPSGHALFSLCFYGGLAIAAARSVQVRCGENSNLDRDSFARVGDWRNAHLSWRALPERRFGRLSCRDRLDRHRAVR